MGKLTISMAIFHSKLLNYQRVPPINRFQSQSAVFQASSSTGSMGPTQRRPEKGRPSESKAGRFKNVAGLCMGISVFLRDFMAISMGFQNSWWDFHGFNGIYNRILQVVPHKAVAEVSTNRKPIGEIRCCESGMAEQIHWWTERCLRSPLFLSFSDYLLTYQPIFYVSIYLSIDLSISLFLSSSNYLSTYLSIYLSLSLSFICLSVYLSICLAVCLSIYLSVYLSICLSVCLSMCLSIYLSLSLSVCPSVCLSICLSVYLSTCLPVYLSICGAVSFSVM